MRKLNKPLLRRLARKLRRLRHEEHFDQMTWASKTGCGTAACVAGHAVIEGGYRLNLVVDPPYSDYDGCRRLPSSRVEGIEEVAQRLLGLTQSQAGILFSDSPGAIWPEPYSDRWYADKERPSRIAADFLDAIADTNGKVLEGDEAS